MRELEESFGAKVKALERAMVENERTMSGTFDLLIKQADTQIQKRVNDMIHANEDKMQGQMEVKLNEQMREARRDMV